MKVMEYAFPATKTRTQEYRLYPLGDVHIGALNCAEKQFRRVVRMIETDKNARWFGGGDLLDSVILQDQKRFDPASLPDWMFKGTAKTVKARIKDIVAAQRDRLLSIIDPIKDKCIGLMEGNHEYSIMKYHNRDLMHDLCSALDVPALTDCCFLRFRFTREKRGTSQDSVIAVRMFACHGHGGGRSEGSEPNHLARLAKDKECEIVLRGHSHTEHIMPPISRLSIPTHGSLGDEADQKIVRAANWGCYVRTYAAGESTYDSRATYPVRPLSTVRVLITPFRQVRTRTKPKVIIEELEMP